MTTLLPRLRSRRVALGLGGNLGDVASQFRGVLDVLTSDGDTRVVRASRLFETAAVGHADASFLNAAVIVDTALPSHDLLRRCQRAEDAAERRRDQRWSDRPVDVDILLIESTTESSESLTVPHPLMHVRRFVLDPLAEIAPDAVHPVVNQTIGAMQRHWQQRPLRVQVPREFQSQFDGLDQYDVVEADADLTLTFADSNANQWPPVIDLRSWPLTGDLAVEAALRSVLDEPSPIDDAWCDACSAED